MPPPRVGANALLLGFIAAFAAIALLGVATMGPGASRPAGAPVELLDSFDKSWHEWEATVDGQVEAAVVLAKGLPVSKGRNAALSGVLQEQLEMDVKKGRTIASRLAHKQASAKPKGSKHAKSKGSKGPKRANVPALAVKTMSLDGETDVAPPDAAAVAALYKEKADAVFAILGVDAATFAEETDLEASCGAVALACVATVGQCLDNRISTSMIGEKTPATNACQCFAKGYAEAIPLDGPDVRATCPYGCLASISMLFTKMMVDANGDGARSVECPTTFRELANVEFGGKGEDMPSDGDTDAMVVIAPDDKHALDAAKALKAHINEVRMHECKDKGKFEALTLKYAKRGQASGGRGEYRLEADMGTTDDHVFTGRVAHLPKDKQESNPFYNGDKDGFLSRYVVMNVHPDPCSGGDVVQMISTEAGAKAINEQQLSWRAEHKAHHEGVPQAAFGLGLKTPPAAQLKAAKMVLSTDGFVPPVSYDARDYRADVEECRAYNVLNQGSCGSCYAFAAATAYSARVCRQTESKWNIVASPQEMMDCTGGCDGGWPLTIFEKISGETSAVENWCDPYTQHKDTCGGACDNGVRFHSLKDSARSVGDETPDGVKQMQKELMMNGPGAMAMTVYSDFGSYSSGVYTVSADAEERGGHAVTLVGWGEEAGVPYWLIQNSWGAGSGDNGFWKIRRGTNEADCEKYGLLVVKPELPVACPNVDCLNKGTVLADCSCRCNGGWTGALCDACELTCENGGVKADDCSECHCPDGFFGEHCENGFEGPSAACEGDAGATWTFSFPNAATRPTQRSILGIYKLDETTYNKWEPYANQKVCGSTYDANVDGGLCPETGFLKIQILPNVGEYKVALQRFLPPNAEGLSGYRTTFKESDVIGHIQVLARTCTAQDREDATAAHNPTAKLNAKLAAIKASQASTRAEMDARMDAADPVIAELKAEQESVASEGPATLQLMGTTPVANGVLPWVTTGKPYHVCWSVKPSQNMNPKTMILYTSNGLSYYSTVLQDAGPDLPLAAAAEGCIDTVVLAGLPDDEYMLKTAGGGTDYAQLSFNLRSAQIEYTGLGYNSQLLMLRMYWKFTVAASKPGDVIKVINSHGTVVHWFFTSCQCQTAPGPDADPVPTGRADVLLHRAGAVLGGYTLSFFPEGDETAAAESPYAFNFASIGW